MSQPLVPQPVSSQPGTRTLTAIDADLYSCRVVRRDAEKELADVRRRQEELADLEAALVVTIDTRCRLLDHLLDERLRAAGGVSLGLPAPARGNRPLSSLT